MTTLLAASRIIDRRLKAEKSSRSSTHNCHYPQANLILAGGVFDAPNIANKVIQNLCEYLMALHARVRRHVDRLKQGAKEDARVNQRLIELTLCRTRQTFAFFCCNATIFNQPLSRTGKDCRNQAVP